MRAIVNLILIFVSLFLIACSHDSATKKKPIDESQEYAEAAIKARKTGPLEGDIRVMNGVEYVWGRNVKYMSNAAEPANIWVRRDLYTPSLIDTIPGRVGSPTETKELSDLEQRLARLERAARGESVPAPQTARPEQPVKDATGRTWTRYFSNDDGVEWFLDKSTLQPSSGVVQLWRKMVFPRWAYQKEIVTLDDLSCPEARYRTRELRVTNWDGPSQTSDKVTHWANVFSGSPEDYLMNEYCK